VRPEPTWIRAARGPMPARIPRLDALIRTPGMMRIPNPINATLDPEVYELTRRLYDSQATPSLSRSRS
jgi:hypothetical protein